MSGFPMASYGDNNVSQLTQGTASKIIILTVDLSPQESFKSVDRI
jgi:hypothetical protein